MAVSLLSLRRRGMFIAHGCETVPPSVGGACLGHVYRSDRRKHPPSVGGPCPSVFSSGQQSWFNPKEHMAVLRGAHRFTTCAINIALLWRAERPATRTINMTLLRRGGRNGQTSLPSYGGRQTRYSRVASLFLTSNTGSRLYMIFRLLDKRETGVLIP